MNLSQSKAVIKSSNNGNSMIANLNENFQNLADIVNYQLVSNSTDLSMQQNGRITYTGSEKIDFIVACGYSLLTTISGISMGVCLYKNGEQVEESIIFDPNQPIILNFPITLKIGDYLEMWANCSSSEQLEIIQCQLSITGYSLT